MGIEHYVSRFGKYMLIAGVVGATVLLTPSGTHPQQTESGVHVESREDPYCKSLYKQFDETHRDAIRRIAEIGNEQTSDEKFRQMRIENIKRYFEYSMNSLIREGKRYSCDITNFKPLDESK